MNKYFLAGFALLLLGLYVGLRTGSWMAPTKTKVVHIKAKKSPPQIRVVKVPVPAAPMKCEESAPVHREISSVPKTPKPKRKWTPPAPVAAIPPKETDAAPLPPVFPEGKPVSASLTIPNMQREPASQKIEVENGPGQTLVAPTIKSIQTED